MYCDTSALLCGGCLWCLLCLSLHSSLCHQLLFFSLADLLCMSCCSVHQWFLYFSGHFKSVYLLCPVFAQCLDCYSLFSHIQNGLICWVILFNNNTVFIGIMPKAQTKNRLNSLVQNPSFDVKPKYFECIFSPHKQHILALLFQYIRGDCGKQLWKKKLEEKWLVCGETFSTHFQMPDLNKPLTCLCFSFHLSTMWSALGTKIPHKEPKRI